MKSSKNNRYLYEDAQRWDELTISDYIQEKIDLIRNMIPSTVCSIVDLGCGNGVVTNRLAKNQWVVGLDRSQTALQSVTAIRVNASIDFLPFSYQAFDFVLVSEVLEHLPESVLKASVNEIQRICKEYLLVTVPNDEYLPKNYLKCPECAHVFNASYHLHSFDKEKLLSLFPQYHLVHYFECGKPVRQYAPFLLKIKQQLGRSWTRIAENRSYICPLCRHRFTNREKLTSIAVLCNGLNRVLLKQKPYWMGVLLKKC